MSVELKLRSFTASEIAGIVGGQLININGADETARYNLVSTDSRECADGVVFCAIKGENLDGNDYIADAAARGCPVSICQKIPEGITSPFSAIIVDDTVKALGAFAKYYRCLSKAKFIAVTGSVGKTTTKEFIYAVASAGFKTYKTQGNYNNQIGLPLTILGIEPDTEVAVVEMGMSALGEIENMTLIARPDIAVITNIGTSHLASLGTRENICRAKMEIRLGLPEDGILLLNSDEPLLYEQYVKLGRTPKLMSMYSHTGDYRAVNVRQKPDGMVYDLIYSNKAVTNVEIPALGKHNVYNSLTAYAVGVMLGLDDETICAGMKNFVSVDKRLNVYDVNGITIIDDCYNASPESMRAGIDVLVAMAAKKNARPCALLGDMLELGEYSRLMHDQVGQYAAQAQVQKLFCYGSMADVIAEAAIKKGIRAENVAVCLDSNDPKRMADIIMNTLSAGDILLVKASRAVAAENVIANMKKRRRTGGVRKTSAHK